MGPQASILWMPARGGGRWVPRLTWALVTGLRCCVVLGKPQRLSEPQLGHLERGPCLQG